MTAIKRQNPSSFNALKSLLQADFTVQLRQGRSIAVGVLLPLLYLFALRRAIPALGGTAVLAQCLSIGVPAIGLMGYAVVLSRDRDHGVFQRLRATPSTTTILMSSRILVQLAIIVVMTLVTIIAAAFIDDIQVGASKIPEAVVANLLVGLMFLSIGQTVVALLTSSESVNAVARFVYIGFLVMGTFLVPSRPGVDSDGRGEIDAYGGAFAIYGEPTWAADGARGGRIYGVFCFHRHTLVQMGRKLICCMTASRFPRGLLRPCSAPKREHIPGAEAQIFSGP